MQLPRVSLIVGEVDHVDRCHEEYGRATCYAECLTFVAEVVEWQTRTFEGRVAKAVRVQVPPSAPFILSPNLSLPDPIFFTGSGPFGPRMYVANS